MLGHQLAPELQRVDADRMRELVHEAFDVDRVVVDVDAAPEARRNVRIAHGVIDQQVRHAVAERGLARRVEALERDRVLAVLHARREHGRQDRLAGDAHVQSGQVVVLVERADHLALGDRVIEAVLHVLFAGPQQLDRRARHLLGDQHRLDARSRRVPRRPKPPPSITLCTSHLVGRQARRRDRGCERRLAVLRAAPHLALVGRESAVAFIGSIGAWFWYGYE